MRESTFTLVYWGFILSFPTKGQLVFLQTNATCFFPETKILKMKKLWQEHQENPDKMCSDPVKDFVFEKKRLTQKPLYGGINMEEFSPQIILYMYTYIYIY